MNHKIIVGAPRSGTTFITRWIINKFTDYEALSENRSCEHFEPEHHPSWPNLDKDEWDAICLDRIKNLKDKSIFKLIIGPEVSEHVFDYVSDKPVILVKRKDVLGQFLSYGIGRTTNKWLNYNDEAKSYNGLKPNQTFHYQREWFDDLADRLIDLNKRKFKIDHLVWFEDIPKFEINGKLPLKQNWFSNKEKMKLLTNADQFMDWFLEFRQEANLKDIGEYLNWNAGNNEGNNMGQLPEGRKALTDKDMEMLLHNIARTVGQFGSANLDAKEIRQTAERFSELAKAASVAQHKAQQG